MVCAQRGDVCDAVGAAERQQNYVMCFEIDPTIRQREARRTAVLTGTASALERKDANISASWLLAREFTTDILLPAGPSTGTFRKKQGPI